VRLAAPILFSVFFAVVVEAGDQLGFSEGMAPLADTSMASAALCGRCHAEQLQEWRATRHAQSFSNALFLNGFAFEPNDRCIHCHAPTRQQKQDVVTRRETIVKDRSLASLPADSPVHEGITCTVCHLRSGNVVVTEPSDPTTSHTYSARAAMKDSGICKGCHEFRSHIEVNGKPRLESMLAQSTYTEWIAYRAAGGTRSCQSCHMPDGSHSLRGAHDVAFLRAALDVQVDDSTVVIASRRVGHSFPTGDGFRHLTVIVDGVTVARIGRIFSVTTGRTVVVEDTSLRPGIPLRVPLPQGSRSLSVRYHYTLDSGDRGLARGPNDSVVILKAINFDTL
jgi:hypothetical protein